MAYKNLFLDSDVLLDLLLEREPFSYYAAVLMEESAAFGLTLNTSALIIANINYIAAQKFGKAGVILQIKTLIEKVKILAVDSDAVHFAVNSDFTDFEDAIQHFIATANNCDAIISRNIKDYKYATIPVLTAEQFLRTIL